MIDNNSKAIFIQSFKQKAGQRMAIGISILLVCILMLVVALRFMSPGKLDPILGENGSPLPGSLSEKVFVNINSVEQGMFIQSKALTHPVLLILHGGMPEYFLTDQYPTGLEDDFTVVWWEQRGSGMSYHADIPRETLTLEQLIADTLAVTDYLRSRFQQDKIYLMGHSGGSFIGIQAAARAPDLYHTYIGQAQIAYTLKSEQLAYEYMLQQFKAQGNTKMMRKLAAAPVTVTGGVPVAYRAVRDDAMHALGIGTTHDMTSIVTGIFLPSWHFKGYSLTEKFNLWRGKAQSGIAALCDTMLATDLSQKITELQIPVYFLEGIYDYTCSYTLAMNYFEKIKAPIKGFYTFEQSAHSPMFEEPEKTRKILREDVLAGTNNLADKITPG